MDDLRKKVITGLECCILRDPDDHARCSQCSYGGNCVNRLKMDALELLKAKEPVKPLVTGNGHTFAEAETWWYECGNCNNPIDPNDQYCRHCGRAVKWDD